MIRHGKKTPDFYTGVHASAGLIPLLLPRSPNRVADVKRRVNANVFRFRDVWSQTEADVLRFFPQNKDGRKEQKSTLFFLH